MGIYSAYACVMCAHVHVARGVHVWCTAVAVWGLDEGGVRRGVVGRHSSAVLTHMVYSMRDKHEGYVTYHYTITITVGTGGMGNNIKNTLIPI